MDDEKIIEMYFDRNQKAVEETEKKYGRYCFSLAARILANKEDSEECVNDTWLSAWNSIPPQRPKYLKMFLAKITRNKALNRLKADNTKKRGKGEVPLIYEELSECIGDGRDIESDIIAKELGLTIKNFVFSLPEREGNIFVRRYFFMECVKNIAEKYGMTPGNVSVILNRTRNKLKEHLISNDFI